MIPVYRSKLPLAEQCLPYLKQIDQNRIYSNFGPLENNFKERFKKSFLPKLKNEIISANNATSAMVQILRFWSNKEKCQKQYVICPSWTFVATAAAIVNSNLIPVLVDSHYDSQTPSVEELEKKITEVNNTKDGKVIAIIVTMPFGESVAIDNYIQLAKRSETKLLIDAAAGLDAISSLAHSSPWLFTDFTSVISLHATKAFGIGEGAIIISESIEEAKAIAAYGNFGFSGSRDAIYPGTNNKLSEYMAAVGLAMLDNVELEKQEWRSKRQMFIDLVQSRTYIQKNSMNTINHINPYGNVRLDSTQFDLESIEEKLKEKGIETRKWWGMGVHQQSYYRSYLNNDISSSRDFINTEKIAEETLGLPFFREIEFENLEYIFFELDKLRC